jgi:anti-sigma factor RsiW
MTAHDEVESLLGAYALDAVDPSERDAVEAHLRECPRCRAEVAEHREVAALLASSSGGDAPAGLWDRITASIDAGADGVDVAPVIALGARTGPRRRPLTTIGAAALAAAAVVAIGLVGWRVVDQGDQIDRLQTAIHSGGLAQAALAAEGDPRARTVELTASDGRAVATAVVLPDGTGYLVRDRLSALGSDRTYQLWAVVGDRTISAGVLGNDPSVLSFRAPASATALAVTDEVAGGVVRTQQKPVAAGDIRPA